MTPSPSATELGGDAPPLLRLLAEIRQARALAQQLEAQGKAPGDLLQRFARIDSIAEQLISSDMQVSNVVSQKRAFSGHLFHCSRVGHFLGVLKRNCAQGDHHGEEDMMQGAAYERTRDGLLRQCEEQRILINKASNNTSSVFGCIVNDLILMDM
eukprot:857279-Rhodomonas_salina.3